MTTFFISTKGQLISKAIYGLLTSPKKRTDEFVFSTCLFFFTSNKSNLSVRFLGESTARQYAFRFYLKSLKILFKRPYSDPSTQSFAEIIYWWSLKQKRGTQNLTIRCTFMSFVYFNAKIQSLKWNCIRELIGWKFL